MRYQVPQFIEVEDKIFGPLTLKQFIYLAGGGGMDLLFFTSLPLYIAIVLSLPISILALALAFYRVNDQPFIVIIEHAFSYQFGAKLYIWKQREIKQPKLQETTTASQTIGVPQLSQSRLKDLAWALNIKDQQKIGISNSNESNLYGDSN